MPYDPLPGKLTLPSRNQERDRWLRDYQLRNPNVVGQVGEGTLPYIEASAYADATGVHRSNAVTIANGVSRATATGQALDDWATRLGTFRLPPVGGAGFVQISTGLAGATITAGLIATGPNNTRFKAIQTANYLNGAQVTLVGITTGPTTNLPAGTILTWQSPPIGLGAACTIVQQADGSGFSGGNNLESDDQLRARLDYIAAFPPASGNDAQYQSYIMVTPGLSVQQAFTIPAVLGPGSKGISLTLRPSQPGANRIPNAAQLALAAAFVQGLMPADDSILTYSLVGSPVTVTLKVLWATNTAGWTDATTFPLYHQFSSTPGDRLVSASPNAGGVLSATAFRLSSPSMTEVPAVGQNIGFLDLPNLQFRRKRILTVTTINSTTYDIVVDTSSGFSDTSYTPINGQPCCPWSDSLNSLITPVVTYFDTLGPGEQFANFFDPGLRQRRSPQSPQYFPNQITNRLLGGALVPQPPQGPQQNQPAVQTLLTTPSMQDVLLTEPVPPYSTPVGSPGISSNLFTLGALVAFPE